MTAMKLRLLILIVLLPLKTTSALCASDLAAVHIIRTSIDHGVGLGRLQQRVVCDVEGTSNQGFEPCITLLHCPASQWEQLSIGFKN